MADQAVEIARCIAASREKHSSVVTFMIVLMVAPCCFMLYEFCQLTLTEPQTNISLCASFVLDEGRRGAICPALDAGGMVWKQISLFSPPHREFQE